MLRAIFVLVAFALVACKPTGPSSPETAPPAASTPVSIVQAASDAPSNRNVLTQLEVDPTDYRFPVAVIDGPSFKDVKLSVGVWTKADSVTEFDDLTASAL